MRTRTHPLNIGILLSLCLLLSFNFRSFAQSGAAQGFSAVSINGFSVLFSETDGQGKALAVLQATAANSGPDISGLTAVVTSSSPDTLVFAGQLNFGPISAGSVATSQNVIVISQPVGAIGDLSALQVRLASSTSSVPVANPGINRHAVAGQSVRLSGAGTTDSSGSRLQYLWHLAKRPDGSNATIPSPFGVICGFVPDLDGRYVVQLVAYDSGTASAVSEVTIGASAPAPPTALAEVAQESASASEVRFNGASSNDPQGQPLTYQWELLTSPAGSQAAFASNTAASASITVDKPGDYTAQLEVDNGSEKSKSSVVSAHWPLPYPKARAGRSQRAIVGKLVRLDGSGSSDADRHRLTYNWALLSVPFGSKAALSDYHSVTPSFVPDTKGTYVAQLIVSDGKFSSRPDTVVVDSGFVLPTANAGANQLVAVGAIAQLDGSQSTDLNLLQLSYQWTLASVPQGSTATLSSATDIRPTLTVDLPGTYIAQLVVSDSTGSSAPAQAIVSTTAIPPIADAGTNQQSAVGDSVILSGAGSYDPTGLPITYSWSLISVPTGSLASLTGALTPTPSFTVDLAGNYVAQLIVSDTNYSSSPATVLVSTGNLPPTANPGSSVAVAPGTSVTLNGAGSTDPQGLPLTYSWALLSVPSGSTAVLSSSTSVTPSFTADLPGIYVAQLVVNDGVLSSAPVNVVINGLFPATITVSLVNSSIDTFASTSGDVHISNPATNTGGTGCNGQIIQIALDNGNLGTLSTPSVCVPVGLQDAPFTLSSNANAGSTTLSGFAQGFQTGTMGFNVNLRQLSMTFDTTTVGQGRVANGTLTLTDPAPSGGVTFNLASSQPSIATVSSPTVTIPAGGTQAIFQVNAVTPGQSIISATPSAGGYASPATTITVLSSALTITIPKNLVVGPGQSLPFPISIGAPASTSVTVTLSTTSGPGTVTFSPSSVTIPAGSITPPTQPTVTGGALGPVSVTANATGYAPDLEAVSVSVTLTLSPSVVNVLTSNTAQLTLSASSKAPAGGLVVPLTLSDPTIASVPANVTIPQGASSIKVTVTGVAQGTTTLTAGGTGYVAATATINVSQAPPIILSGYCPTSVGFNAVLTSYPYNTCYPVLGAPAPAGGVSLTLKSSNAAKLTVTFDPSVVGTASVTLTYAGGSTTPSNGPVYFAGLANSGAANLTATAKGYSTLTTPITLTPSGFLVSGGTTTTTLSPPSTVSVTFANLDPTTLNPTTYPVLRAGAATATATLANDNTKAGKLGATTVSVLSGSGTGTTTYTPAASGTSNITIAKVAGYTLPASQTTTQFVVSPPPITLSGYCPTSVGFNSILTSYPYVNCYPILGAPAPAGGVSLTLKSSNAAKLTLTLNPTTVGTASVTLTYAGGSTTPANGPVYFAGLASSGTVNLTATAKGYSSLTTPITLTPSGFVVSGGTTTTTLSPPSTVYVYMVNLDPTTLSPTTYPNLRAGVATANVTIANDNLKAGKLGAAIVAVTSNSGTGTTTYTPIAPGTSNISITKLPTGYTLPSSQTTTQFVVTPPPIILSGYCPTSVGFNAVLTSYPYDICYPILGAPAPAGGVTLTLKSNNAAKLTVTLDPTVVGTASVTLNYPGGSTTPTNGPVYFAGLTSSGTVNLTSTAKGYSALTTPITLTPSGFVVSGGTTTTTLSPPSTVYASFVNLDPTTLSPTTYPNLRAGASTVNLALTNDNTSVGTLGSSSLSISSDNGQATTTYTPLTAGTSNIGVTTPAGYSTPSSQTTTQFVVTPPPIIFSGYCPTSVGFNTILTYYPYNVCYPVLGAPAPAGGLVLNLTSSDTTKLTLTTNPTKVGSGSLTLNYAAGSTFPSNGPVYFAGISTTGTVTLTASAPAFTSGTLAVSLTPSGFVVSGGTATTTLSPPSTVSVSMVSLDPVSLNPTTYPYLRPGAKAVSVSLSNDNTVVGTLGAASVSVTSTSNGQATTTYTPLTPGISNISVSTPTGYKTPFSQTTTQFMVSPPPISFSGYCPSSVGFNAILTSYPYNLCYPVLGAPAPAGGVTLTLSSSDATKLTLTNDPSIVGSGTLALQYTAGSMTPSNGPVYLAGLASSGTITITASAAGYTSASTTASLTPSGLLISGGTPTTTLSPPSSVSVYFAALDPVSLMATTYPSLRPGAPAVAVSLSNDNNTAGTLGSNSVVIDSTTNGSGTTTFAPLAAGTSNISVGTPSGYTQPFTGTITQFVVTTANIAVQPVTVGRNMMALTYVQLATGAPSDNFPVTISVNDQTQLLLSSTGQDVGVSSVTFNLSQGQTQTPQFWVYALGNPGSAGLSVSATGYNGGGTATIDPSGFIFDNQNFTTTLSSAPTTIYVQPAVLDPVYLSPIAVQQLRPGMTNTQVTITLTDQPNSGGPSKVGTITVDPVVFNGADNPNLQITSFQPLGVGQTFLQLTSPGFSSSSSQVTATVTQ